MRFTALIVFALLFNVALSVPASIVDPKGAAAKLDNAVAVSAAELTPSEDLVSGERTYVKYPPRKVIIVKKPVKESPKIKIPKKKPRTFPKIKIPIKKVPKIKIPKIKIPLKRVPMIKIPIKKVPKKKTKFVKTIY